MNIVARFGTTLCLLAGGIALAALTGCVTKADLDLVARRNPVASGVVKSTRKTLKTPLPAEKLYGKWEATYSEQQIIWKHDGWWKRFPCENWRIVYEFYPDGNYSYEAYKGGNLSTSLKGKWEYVINKYGYAEITINGLALPYRSVFWINEDEMVVTVFRNADSAVQFWLNLMVKDHYPKESWNTWVEYSRDEYLNMHWTSYHISGDALTGYKRENNESAAVFKRIGTVSLAPKPPTEENQGGSSSKSVGTSDSEPSSDPLYTILSCERESGSDFSYRFVLELTGKDKSLRAFRSVQKEFRTAVKEDYAESFPGVKMDSLYIDFPEYKLNNGKIEGRAVVLSISVTSLTYDPNTRRGKLAVKVNANQYEEARKWIRKNIETLARDKNIALVTGEIPPAAKFYLGREELKDGNVLEIEFRTE